MLFYSIRHLTKFQYGKAVSESGDGNAHAPP